MPPQVGIRTARDARAVLDLASGFYGAAGHGDRWPEVLDAFAAELHAMGPGLFVSETATRRNAFVAARDIDRTWLRAYEEHFLRVDVRRPRIDALAAGSVFVGHRLLPDRVLLRSEFYNDFLRPQGLRHIAGTVADDDGRQRTVLRVLRPAVDRPFGARELRLLTALAPHVRGAMALHAELAAARATAASACEALEWFPAAVLLLDRTGRVVAANRRAQSLLDRREVLHLEAGVVTASRPDEVQTLRTLLARAASAGSMLDGTAGTMQLSRGPLRRPLGILAAPLHAGTPGVAASSPAVVVFVRDPDDRLVAPVERVAADLGVTRTEAALALLLAQGTSVADAASQLGVTVATVRTHLKHLLAKTATGRQAELVRLVLSSSAVLVRPGDDG